MMKEKYQQLIRNLRFYHRNLAQYEQQYAGKYLLICEETLAGIYISYEEALVVVTNGLDVGTYLLKHCQPAANVGKVYATKGVFRAPVRS
ncbi:MAG: hypothetical protein JWQ14_2989 [Adhaeribacter sp.]|nr:hypothetical protein [Adhaeribacter sp.]